MQSFFPYGKNFVIYSRIGGWRNHSMSHFCAHGGRVCGHLFAAAPRFVQLQVNKLHTLALHTTGRNSWPYKFVVIMADGRNSCPSNYQAAGRNGWPFTTIDLISTTHWSSTDRNSSDWSSTDWSSSATDCSSTYWDNCFLLCSVLRPLT